MNKKPYAAPQIKQVRLEIKNAILAYCHQSPDIMTPNQTGSGGPPCWATTCHNPG